MFGVVLVFKNVTLEFVAANSESKHSVRCRGFIVCSPGSSEARVALGLRSLSAYLALCPGHQSLAW